MPEPSEQQNLRERFRSEDDKPQETQDLQELQSAVSAMLGVTASGMDDTITNDIQMMIENGQRLSLEGYILCLSKIVQHGKAWSLINKAFQTKNESIPAKYKVLFDQRSTPVLDASMKVDQ